jgi:predicted outer membrane protein
MAAALLGLGACARPGVSPAALGMQHEAGMVLATADQGEMEEAQLALSRSSNDAVRAYAQRMLAEHGADLRMQQGMMSASMPGHTSADMSGMDHSSMSGMDHSAMMAGDMSAGTRDVVNALQSGHQAAMANLGRLIGAAFDRAYMQRQVDAHAYMLSYTNWLAGTQRTIIGSDTLLLGANMDGAAAGGAYAVPLSCDPGRAESAPGSGRSEAGNTSIGNRAAVGSCDGTPQLRPPLNGQYKGLTNADVVAMNRNARAMIAAHLDMARNVLNQTR